VEAVHLIADGKAPRIPQPKEGATYEGIQKKENAEISWDQPAAALHNWIRGHDKVPGAWATIDGQVCSENQKNILLFYTLFLTFFIIKLKVMYCLPDNLKSYPLLFQVLVRNLQFEDGKMIPASKYFSADETTALELTEEEKKMAEDIR
ncbi:AL1L2 dehydrogenase, partial [Balaeniceps rex]|nr:AL1L2 dehydrogenase [Balaeniceps rex]